MSDNVNPYSSMKLGDVIAARKSSMEDIKRINGELSAAKANQDLIDQAIMQQMDAVGLKKSATDEYTVSISETVVPEVDSWDAIFEHIKETGDFSLLQRRVSSVAYREMLEQGAVPGISPRTVRDVNFRSKG